MKQVIMTTVLLATMTGTAEAQDSATEKRLTEVLQSYFTIKDALVAGNPGGAAAGAASFIRNLNGISYTVISEGNVNTLLKDAGIIADASALEKQRTAFVNFSINMTALVKSLKLSASPLYLQYCPMKKASWLSRETIIRNPYYGSSMLGCGKVTETIQ